MFGGFMKVNLKKEMACGKIFHAGYFIRTPQSMSELCAIRQAKKQPEDKEVD